MAPTSKPHPESLRVPLPGSRRDLLPHSVPCGAVDMDRIVSLTIRVRSRGRLEDLQQQVQKLAAQPPSQRKYLSRQALAEGYGAADEDLDAVEQFAAEHDLQVAHRSASQRSIVLTGTLRNLLAAFPADLQMYTHPGGSYRGRRGEIHVPAALKDRIVGIFGYDTRPKHRAPTRVRRLAGAMAGPGGGNGVAATEFARRYRFPDKSSDGKALDGSGQCIAIIELGGGYKHSDLKAFFQEIGVPLPKVSAVSVDHVHNHPTATGAADGEVMLDIEVAGAVCPKAKFAVYFGPNQGNGFLDAINAAVHDATRNPSVISISWGEPEDFITQQGLDAYHEIFTEAAALGITVCAASGDHGVADLDGSSWDKKIHVDHPACDPMVLGCGGTQVDGAQHDVVWNDGTPFDPDTQGGGGWASGGGISVRFAVPDYQSALKMPASIPGKKHGRGVPDIAMSATDYFVRVQGSEGASGGTSAVAPLMSALVARLNQAKGARVGLMQPLLYGQHGLCKAVSKGNNGIKGTVEGYPAGSPWSACAGLGTPDGEAILAAL